eukprot:gene8949-9125_t
MDDEQQGADDLAAACLALDLSSLVQDKEAQALAAKAAGGERMRVRLRRITEELAALSTGLPLAADSSVLLAVDHQRLDVLRAVLLPHPDTPYGAGAFVFDMLLPLEYPDKPPLVHFMTTGGGSVRFNPNLYNCGKVCLSLLGTWSGPSWQPGVSTIMQVLVSLQSMVFVDDPYYNEPGFESSRHTPRGQQQAVAYNQSIRLETARHAILAALQRPDPAFKEALQLHFSLKQQSVKQMLEIWLKEAGNHHNPLAQIVSQINAELGKLPAPPSAAAASPAEEQHRRPAECLPQPTLKAPGHLGSPSKPPAGSAAAGGTAAGSAAPVVVVDLT